MLKDLEYISGPVYWSYFIYEGRNFHFFGDEHGDKGNNCESLGMKCSSKSGDEYNCFDIVFLIETIFKKYSKENRIIDLFIESPYLMDEQTLFPKFKGVQDDYMNDIIIHFIDCLQRYKDICPYKSSRVHYVDIRQDVEMGPSSFHMYLLFLFMNIEEMFTSCLLNLYKNESCDEEVLIALMTFMDKIFQKFFSEEEKLYEKLFYSYFEEDFVDNIDRIFIILISDIKDNIRFLDAKSKIIWKDQFDNLKKILNVVKKSSKMIPKRSSDAKNVHVIKVQLDELSKDKIKYKDKNITDLIQNFIIDEYKNMNIPSILESWNAFYKIFEKTFDLTGLGSEPLTKKRIEILLDEFIEYKTKYSKVKLIEIDTLLMDAYTLARMFRTYSSSKKSNKNIESEMVITYTGLQHAKNYTNFFKNILNLIPITEEYGMKEAKRCIKVNKFL